MSAAEGDRTLCLSSSPYDESATFRFFVSHISEKTTVVCNVLALCHRLNLPNGRDIASGCSGSAIVSSPVCRASEGQKLSTDAYLGSTSYSAVFTEGQSHPQLQDLPDTNDDETQAANRAKLKLGLTESNVQEGADILALLYDVKMHLPTYHRGYNIQCVASLTPFVGECIDMIVQKLEGSHPSKTGLHSFSEQTFVSTSKDVVFQSTTKLQDLPLILMGENLRWDTVGLILNAAGFSAIALDEVGPDVEKDQNQELDWKNTARKLLDAGDKCISFCEKVNSLNDVTVWLITLNYILHTQVEGDAGKPSMLFE